MTTDPSPIPAVSLDRLTELFSQIANAVWILENCIGVLQAAHDDKLPSCDFSVEGVAERMFELAHHSAGQTSKALEALEVECGQQGEVGLRQWCHDQRHASRHPRRSVLHEVDEEQSIRAARAAISRLIGESGIYPRAILPRLIAERESLPSLEFLHAVTRNYWRTFYAGRARQYPAHEKLKHLAPDSFAGIVASMNNQRRRLYERTVGEAMVRSELERRHPGKRFTIEVDSRSFTTAIDGKPTRRRADIFKNPITDSGVEPAVGDHVGRSVGGALGTPYIEFTCSFLKLEI